MQTFFEMVMEQEKQNLSNALSIITNRIIGNISVDRWEHFETEVNLNNLGIDKKYQKEIFKALDEKYPNEYKLVKGIIKNKRK